MQYENELTVAEHANSVNKQKGAGAVEYALVLAVVVTLVVGLSGAMEGGLTAFFEQAVTMVSEFMAGGG